MIRGITGARDTRGESGHGAKAFDQLDRQAGLPAVRRLHRHDREHGGGARRLSGRPRRRRAGRQGSAQASIPPIEDEPGGLQVFDWSGYGNGDYYPKEEKKFLWGQYAKATGDTPEFALFENDDSAYTKVVAGARYDVAHPCGYRYKDWVDLDVLQPWDTSLIPNFSQLNPKLMTAGQFDGQQYFVPLDWGYIAPLVNLDHVDGSDETFNVLFDERYKGKIAWVDTLNMMVVAAYALGIENPWDMTDEELAEVRDFLISKKGLVRFYWNQSFDFWRAFKTEEVWAGYSWPDTVGYADAAGMNYLYMQPKEGRISWVCGLGAVRRLPELPPRARVRGLVGQQGGGGVPARVLLLRAHEHDGGPRRGARGRAHGAQPRRSDRARRTERAPRDLHPAAQHLPAVLERGAGGLSRPPGRR